MSCNKDFADQFLPFLLLCTLICCLAAQDPCLEGNYEVKFGEFQRSVRYEANGTIDDPHLTDRYLTAGWYKFESPSGDRIPTYAPDTLQCGTVYPLWFNGSLPESEQDGIIDGVVCKVIYNNNCSNQYPISVKHCGDGYVYHLVPTTESEPVSYCMGEEIKCPPGYSSETGFTPNCEKGGFPILENNPYITFEVNVIEEMPIPKSVIFNCNLDIDEDVLFDIYWFIGEDLVHSSIEEYTTDTLPAQLTEEKWASDAVNQLDKNVSCAVRAKYTADSVPGNTVSGTLYMGFEVKTQNLEVVENGDPAKYSVRPTIPILCPYGIDGCQLAIEVYEPRTESGDLPATCKNGHSIKQTVVEASSSDFQQSPCAILIPEVLVPDGTWFTMNIYGAVDNQYDGSHNLVLELRTPKVHTSHQIWQGYELPPARVTVHDKDEELIAGQYCHAANDPHMMTFDGRCYENQLAGEFIMYRHSSLPIEVHGYFVNEGSYSRVCGCAVRAGGDLFIYDNCPGQSSGRVKLYDCEDGVISITENTATSYTVHLPTGGRVEITNSIIKVFPSVQDYQSTSGLCGTFTTICEDDFLMRDGSYPDDDETTKGCDRVYNDPERCSNNKDFHPDEFSESWRVPEGDSLFDGIIKDSNRMNDILYCSCDAEDIENPRTWCERTKDQDFCDDSVDIIEANCMEREEGRRLYGSVHSDDVEDDIVMFEYDPDFIAPIPEWSDGWNESIATANCTAFFESVSGMETCLQIGNVDSATFRGLCVLDIQATASTFNNLGHVATVLSSCQNELLRNMSLYQVDNSTGSYAPPYDLLNQFCPADCSKQGDCINGTCACYEGYVGEACSINENKIPELRPISQGGLCDKSSRPCQSTPIQGDYFIKSPTLVCKMSPIEISIDGTLHFHPAKMVPGIYEHMKRMFCPIPTIVSLDDTEMLTVAYDVAVSNNAIDFSDDVRLVTFDSKCMECSLNFTCTLKDTSCYIDGNCYLGGEKMQYSIFVPESSAQASSPCNVCDPSKDIYTWTDCSSSSTGLIIGGSLLLVASLATVAVGSIVAIKKKKNKAVRVHSSDLELKPETPSATPDI